MAFVVARRDGRFEIRESISTPAGPRARTLAGFRVLSDDVLRDAGRRAQRPFDLETVRARARALKAPEQANAAAVSASALLAQLRNRASVPPVLVAELRKSLPEARDDIPDSLEDAIEWVGASDAEKGRWVRELLLLESAFPPRGWRGDLTFPRITSRPT